jgi:uncharacterized protein involved in exopolysaccharide biosynthesis
MEDLLTIKGFIRALVKRLWLIIPLAALGSAAAVMIALVLPPVYVSQAKILIESQQIPDELAATTITGSTEERLQLIQQRLMTRDTLIGIIERLGLYEDRPELSLTDRVSLVRASTTLQQIAVNQRSSRDKSVSAFVIAYRDGNPNQTAKVTNEFITIVLEQNLRDRSARAAETLGFFEDQVKNLEAEMNQLGSQIAQFYVENRDKLPETIEIRQSELNTIDQGRSLLDQRVFQLAEEKRVLELQLQRGTYGPEAAAMTPQEAAVRETRNELVELKSVYAPTHPRIRSLENKLQALEASLGPVASDAGEATGQSDLEFARSELERRIRLISAEIENIEERIRSSSERRDYLISTIGQTPETGLALNALQRRFDDLEVQYNSALRNRAAAETGEKLEVNRQAERFEIIEQAQIPSAPESPNRPLIAGGGSALSLAAALGLALLLEFMNKSIRTVGDLERKLELRPIITIPYIETLREQKSRRNRVRLFVLFIVVFFPLSIYLLDQYYLPVDLLWQKVLDASGIDHMIDLIMRRFG